MTEVIASAGDGTPPASRPETGATIQSETTDRKYFWDWMVNEVTFLNNRTSLFLVAQSMLLGGTVTLTNFTLPQSRFAAYVLMFTGLLACCIWLFVSSKALFWTIKPLQAKCWAIEPRCKLHGDTTAEKKHRLRISDMLSIGFPTLYILAWIILLIGYTATSAGAQMPGRYQMHWDERMKAWVVFDTVTGEKK